MNVIYLQNDSMLSSACKCHLSLEESVVLSDSLEVLKGERKFQVIEFWGKIIGKDASYYISVGRRQDALLDQHFFYSLDCLNWQELSVPECFMDWGLSSTFSGDPSHLYEIPSNETSTELYEEQRLASTVALIQHETAIAPRGAYYQTVDGTVKINPSFSGLPANVATSPLYYLHLRPPAKAWIKGLWKSIDFLQPISEDLLKNQWTIGLSQGNNVVVIRNYTWPGMVFYHQVESKYYSQLYIGCGRSNNDLHFMF